jgi:hypothetical protein
MSDFLLELSKNPQARRFIDSLGLPLSLPEALRRAGGAWVERPLEGLVVAAFGAGSGELSPLIARTVIESGADVLVLDGPATLPHYKGPAEAWARHVEVASATEPPEGRKIGLLVADATGFDTPRSLRGLYEFLHHWVPPQVRSVEKALASAAFGRERLGRRGKVGEIDPDRFNVHGGSLAIGHPFGATGARMVTTMANELHRSDRSTALLGICAAGGLGAGAVLERV